jgi:hypothetical protein
VRIATALTPVLAELSAPKREPVRVLGRRPSF